MVRKEWIDEYSTEVNDQLNLKISVLFDEPVKNVEVVSQNIMEALHRQRNEIGLAPMDEEATTVKIMIDFLQDESKDNENTLLFKVELYFDEKVEDTDEVVDNVFDALFYQKNEFGLAPSNEEAVTIRVYVQEI